jgi:hypothetical protein
MPITAKLSNKFYEKLGDDVANELVEWLNLVDTSYRQEFKDLFEANFRRVESEMGGLRAHLESEMGRLREEMSGLRQHVDARIIGFEGVMTARMAGLEDRLDAKLEKQKSTLLFWNFVFWVGTVGALVGVLKL